MKKILLIVVVSWIIVGTVIFMQIHNKQEQKKIELENQAIKIENQKQLMEDISKHYNKYVITNKEITLYQFDNNKYVQAGLLGNNQIIELKDMEITYEDEYLPLETFDGYYVFYQDIEKVDSSYEYDQRYKNYIPYNENIITINNTSFYDKDDNLVYKFNKIFSLPIIIKENDKYGVEFNNQLLYIKISDVEKIEESQNTDEKNTDSIAVLNYHFFYDGDIPSERRECNQSICLSTQMFAKHLDYIKDNHIFTPTLTEFEMYLDEKIQLPKSVVITIDDGWRSEQGRDLLEQYELNATIFLITTYHETVPFLHDYQYVEYHSHSDNLHNQGDCPGGQGGAIKCKSREYLLNDLKVSREKLDGSKYFCYPFYEYNDYSISVLKEAGFTMAFAGGGRRAYIGVDKYQIPRFAIQSYDTASSIASYIGI
ncbi:MAG: polysaccharide deacetylase family protein [Bacilli bacterium]|nr:polysaccharide deacetylase family protein [Bacilli bacterium]